MPEARFPRGSDDHDEKNAVNSSDTWTCDACLMSNKNPAVRCRGCESLKYGVGLERQWIPAVDMNIDTSCNEIQTTGKHVYQKSRNNFLKRTGQVYFLISSLRGT